LSDTATPAAIASQISTPDVRWYRYVYRAPLLLWHVLVDLPIVLLLINPLSARIRIRGLRMDYHAVRFWQGNLMRILGFSIRAYGQAHPGACLSVANHVSWLDITLIHSQRVVHFVAKSEISRWPLIGWMARRAGTIYHRRGNTDSLTAVAQMMCDRMRAGESVGVFPEGGSSTAFFVRTFHARIFQPALEAMVPVQPIALRYTRAGQLDAQVPFRENESFFSNFLRLLGGPGGVAEVHFLALVPAVESGRRGMAEAAKAAISTCVGAN
jgi:1-acyl-sn-glycerol-3-phosphate acyltransferase